MNLSVLDILQIVGILVSLLTSIVGVIISIITLRQNHKMVEESSRAIIGVYSDSINTGSPMLYLIVKNFGNSLATITKFDYDFDFTDCYSIKSNRDYLKDLINCAIAPGQSRICRIDYKKITSPVTFNIEYKSCNKLFHDTFTIDLKTGTTMPVGKVDTTGKELRTISYILQEMLTKDL